MSVRTTDQYKIMESDLLLSRNAVDRTNGYSLRRNRSPVTMRPRVQNTSATVSNAEAASRTEVHYAIPHTTRTSYNGHPSNIRYLSAIPGPSSMAAQLSTDNAKEFLSTSQIPIINRQNDANATSSTNRSATSAARHISFEPTIRIQSDSSTNSTHTTPQRTSSSYIIGTENYFVGKRIAGKAIDSKTPMIKSYWEANIQREEKLKEESGNTQKKKTFGFPRWRSNDALSASLVASKGNVEIPADSKIPQHRLKKLEQTELLAQQTKAMIQQNAEVPKKLQKGKSLDSLIMQLDYQPWYDRNQIRDGISRESIANLVATKDKFECSMDSGNSRRHTEDTNLSSYFDSQSQTKLSQRYSSDRQKEKLDSYTKADKGEVPQQDREPEFSQERQLSNNYYGSKQNSYSTSKTASMDRQQNFKNPDMNLTAEQEIFLLYVKQNNDLVESLGITIPYWVRGIINELPWRKIELKPMYDEEPRRQTAEFKSYQPQAFNKDSNNQSQNNKSGRYLKNPAAINGNNNHRIISRKTFETSTKQIPENRRPIMQEVDRERAGDSLIAAEIRMLRDREEELRRSRSELGLPSLEDTIEIWKNGYSNNSNIHQANALRSAVSYDHLHQAVQQIPKTASIERLHPIVDDQPRNLCDTDTALLSNDHLQFTGIDEKLNRQSLYGSRISANGRSVYADEETLPAPNVQKISQYHPVHSKNQYKLQNSDDPDIMIYGPTTRRYSSTLTDSTLHLVVNSVPVEQKDTSMSRYE